MTENEKSIFVFENFYRRYRESQGAEPFTHNVLKARDVREVPAASGPDTPAAASDEAASPEPTSSVRIEPYQPPELLGRRLARAPGEKPELSLRIGGDDAGEPPPTHPAANPFQDAAIQNLRQNLQALGELQTRLRFMLKELEELIKE